jgi:hypothetical protein
MVRGWNILGIRGLAMGAIGCRFKKGLSRALYQCSTCLRQTSLTAGTIFAATNLGLRVWFRALCHLTQTN